MIHISYSGGCYPGLGCGYDDDDDDVNAPRQKRSLPDPQEECLEPLPPSDTERQRGPEFAWLASAWQLLPWRGMA